MPVLLASLVLAARLHKSMEVPPNEPAKMTYANGHLTLEYMGHTILSGDLDAPKGVRSIRQPVIKGENGQIDQVFAVTVDGEASFIGSIAGGEHSFACASERPDGNDRMIVRHAFGLSENLNNRAVYCRGEDWLVSFDPHSEVQLLCDASRKHLSVSDSHRYEVFAKGSEIIIRFRPRYYSIHRGLKHFEPWHQEEYKKPIVGWCSWFAYFQDITEDKIKKAADVLSNKLKPYGLEYLQIDDGYQRDPVGFSETWLQPNNKFPSGLGSLAKYISDKGLKPGIWSYTSFHKEDDVKANPNLFVQGTDGKPAYGRWVGYSPDGSNKDALKKIIDPLYKGYVDQGWKYFKVDSLRHLRYEGYNSHSDYFEKKGTDRVESYRNVVKEIRSQTGANFLLACWGARPELAGLVDGCRIGDDGFSYVGLAQFNSFNNVVWRNDPDHIQLTPQEAYRSCMVTSLTGSLFMLTDKPEQYQDGDLEPAKRCIPVLETKPCQVYDVDPSRTSVLNRVDSEVSGDGPRPFDAAGAPQCELYSLECNAPSGNYLILGRVPRSVPDDPGAMIHFDQLGLDPTKTYEVFEFWTKSYLGSFKDSFHTPKVDPKFGCQCICIRESTNQPQILATSRHITCGAFELGRLKWQGKELVGTSDVVAGDPYDIFVLDGKNLKFGGASCENATVVDQSQIASVHRVRFLSKKSGVINWRLTFGGS